jgi:hypothetical protein
MWVVGMPLVVLAGVARIYCGVHSVAQVVVGWLLGTVSSSQPKLVQLPACSSVMGSLA